jgi:hypothetical protein
MKGDGFAIAQAWQKYSGGRQQCRPPLFGLKISLKNSFSYLSPDTADQAA